MRFYRNTSIRHHDHFIITHLRWSSRYLDEPPRPASRWSSRQRLSVAAFSGYTPASTEDSPERLRHASSHSSLLRISIPVPQRRASRGSIHSLFDCIKASQEVAESQPLFVVPDPAVRETPLNSPPRRYNRSSLKMQKTAEEERRLMTPAEIKRKTFLRKISLQDTHINYNQDYWLEYEKSSRFHASLDLGYFTPADNNEKPKELGPINLENIQAINAISNRQSNLPLKSKNKFITRGDSEPHIVTKMCSCNECGVVKKPTLNRANTQDSSRPIGVCALPSKPTKILNVLCSPSTENLLFLERVGHIETEFDVCSDSSSGAFSEVSLNVTSPRSTTFDFDGGSAFFGEGIRNDTPSSGADSPPQTDRSNLAFTIPAVSVSRPSNSPSPIASATDCK